MTMQYYSQHGEDRLLWDFFRGQRDGVCVEVGGYDGVTFSNTLAFEEQGWQAIVVEPMPHFAAGIKARRPGSTLFSCAAGKAKGRIRLVIAHGVETLSTTTAMPDHLERIKRMGGRTEETEVDVRTMDDLLTEAGVGKVDFVSIDVEGGELDVLAGFDLDRWRPRVILLEAAGHKERGQLHDAMLRRGYHWYTSTGCNEWFLPETETAFITPERRLKNRFRRWHIRGQLAMEASGLKGLERRIRRAVRGQPQVP